ncbi:ABC transporter substrate-binding protein [Clostridium estertheticum]|uniref:ABC transporter substrate-binding protein n=1 Tax=Clostridium estertheticum TaxID=238834 RepID=UPI001CD129C0|nr:ABC transporter substrate-binding protein [Clostridium estertheticum]MBZ9685011.1 ABC transporter substrate-binding protein [Clostridium estertheticum]
MKKKSKFLSLLFLAIFAVSFVGCEKNKDNEEKNVSMYMWGGSESINNYMDKWVAPRLKDKGIKLNRVPVTDIKDTINKLITEKQVGKIDGSVDILWLNGENFKLSKESKILSEPFVDALSNYNKYVAKDSPEVKYDFGEETSGLEAPWGKVQFVFIYDSEKIKTPPKSFAELKIWIKNNPGKFAYPSSDDFTGSAFLRQGLFELNGGYEKFMTDFNEKAVEGQTKPLWDYLNEIKPSLWQQGKTYPETLAKLDKLYSNGEVWMTMGYDEARAESEMKKGNFPDSTKTFVLDRGTLANTHFLTIPFNSSHKGTAKEVIDFLLSPEAQIAKLNPDNWGDGLSIDINKLSPEDVKKINEIDRGKSTLNLKELQSHRIPEIKADYVKFIEKGWIDNVAKK